MKKKYTHLVEVYIIRAYKPDKSKYGEYKRKTVLVNGKYDYFYVRQLSYNYNNGDSLQTLKYKDFDSYKSEKITFDQLKSRIKNGKLIDAMHTNNYIILDKNKEINKNDVPPTGVTLATGAKKTFLDNIGKIIGIATDTKYGYKGKESKKYIAEENPLGCWPTTNKLSDLKFNGKSRKECCTRPYCSKFIGSVGCGTDYYLGERYPHNWKKKKKGFEDFHGWGSEECCYKKVKNDNYCSVDEQCKSGFCDNKNAPNVGFTGYCDKSEWCKSLPKKNYKDRFILKLGKCKDKKN